VVCNGFDTWVIFESLGNLLAHSRRKLPHAHIAVGSSKARMPKGGKRNCNATPQYYRAVIMAV
jgi:hypothetical protein